MKKIPPPVKTTHLGKKLKSEVGDVFAPEVERISHIRPPKDLPAGLQGDWWDIVYDFPPQHFRNSDVPLLSVYIQTNSMNKVLLQQIQNAGPSGMIEEVMGGGTRPSGLMSAYERNCRLLMTLGTKLRLTPSSRAEGKLTSTTSEAVLPDGSRRTPGKATGGLTALAGGKKKVPLA